jgi:hypothetical protein
VQDRKVITFLEKEVVLVKAHGTKEVMAGAKSILTGAEKGFVMVGGGKRVLALGSLTGVVVRTAAVAVVGTVVVAAMATA